MTDASAVGARGASDVAVEGMAVRGRVAAGVAVVGDLGVRVGVGVTGSALSLQAERLIWIKAKTARVVPMIEMAVWCVLGFSIVFTSV
jgi:hypothetical protein